MYFRLIVLVVSILILTGCMVAEPESGVIPTHEEIVKRQEVEVTPHRVEQYCYDNGGKYEDWDNHDGTSTTYCILPEGYGCDPVEYYKGNCGMFVY